MSYVKFCPFRSLFRHTARTYLEWCGVVIAVHARVGAPVASPILHAFWLDFLSLTCPLDVCWSVSWPSRRPRHQWQVLHYYGLFYLCISRFGTLTLLVDICTDILCLWLGYEI
jgi:hypothetical protein